MARSDCPECLGTGWKSAPQGGVMRCACLQPAVVSDEIDVTTLTAEEKSVWQLLSSHHRGHANAILQSDIAHKLQISRREVGAIVARLVTERHARIGASCGTHSGYFVIETQDELREATRNLESRMIELAHRYRALDKRRYYAFIDELSTE